MSEKLKICPYCGNVGNATKRHDKKQVEVGAYIRCFNPDCYVSVSATNYENAVTYWNNLKCSKQIEEDHAIIE